MMAVVRNPSGFYLVIAFPKGLRFTVEVNTREILQEIKNWREQHGVGSAQKSSIHAHNAKHHTAKLSMDFLEANDMRKVPHPRNSLDLTSPDFFLCSGVKRQPSGCSFGNTDDLLMTVHHILDGSHRPKTISVREESVRRPRKCIGIEGEYVG
jgi:hypothetical protein